MKDYAILTFRLALALIFTLGVGAKAMACSCVEIEDKSVSEQIYGDIIFVGRPIRSRYEVSNADWEVDAVTTFEVTRNLKGELGQTVEILHSQLGASCGVQFILGHMQVISAHQTELGLQTSLCSNPLPSMTLIDYFENNSNPVLKSSTSCFDTGGLVKSSDPTVYSPLKEAEVVDPACKIHTLEGKRENFTKWEKWLAENIKDHPPEKKRRWWHFRKD